MLAPRDRATMLTYAVLLLVTAAAWASMLWSPMDADEMAGTGMVMAPSVGEAVAFVAAWAVMMAAMMLPSALPMIGLYAATQRGAPSPAAKAAAIAAFVLMYLVVWAMTGLPIYFASVALMARGSFASASRCAIEGAGRHGATSPALTSETPRMRASPTARATRSFRRAGVTRGNDAR